MAVSRPLLLALIAAVLCAITFYAASGAQRTSGVSSAAAPPAPAPVEQLEPTERLDDAPARPRDGDRADGARDDGAGNRGDRQRGGRDRGERGAPGRDRGERNRDSRNRSERNRSERNRSERNRSDRPRRNTAAPPLPPELRVEGLPRPVARALAAKRKIVLFFRQGGADDALTAEAVDSVRGMRGVAVFTAPIERLGRYSAVISGLGLAQAPAVAVVGRNRKARVLQGFVDAGTLRQLVLDVR